MMDGIGQALAALFWLVVILVIVVIFLSIRSCVTPSAAYDDGYQQGQIDALTGNIKYELVEQPNGEKLWERIEDSQ